MPALPDVQVRCRGLVEQLKNPGAGSVRQVDWASRVLETLGSRGSFHYHSRGNKRFLKRMMVEEWVGLVGWVGL